jgi:hypothetical protein
MASKTMHVGCAHRRDSLIYEDNDLELFVAGRDVGRWNWRCRGRARFGVESSWGLGLAHSRTFHTGSIFDYRHDR